MPRQKKICTFQGKMRQALFFLFLMAPLLHYAQDVEVLEEQYFDLIDQAREFALSGSHDSAWQKTLQATSVWEQEDPFFGYLGAFEEMGTFYISAEMQDQLGKKDYKTAVKYFSFSLEKFPLSFSAYDPQEAEYLADINAMLGNAFKKSSNILEAKSVYQKAFTGYRHLDSIAYDYDKRWVALYVYKPLANIYTRLENYENATSLLLLSQSILEAVGKKGEGAQAAIDLGILYATTERHQEAIDLFTKHYDNADLSDYIKSVLLLNRARSLMNTSETQAALTDINRAIHLLKTGEWPGVLLDAYHILGQLQTQKGNLEAAKSSLEYAIDLGKQTLPEKSRKRAKIYASLGNFYLQKNDPKTALHAFQKSLYCVLKNVDSSVISSTPDFKNLYAENTILTAFDGKATAFQGLFQESENPTHLEEALENLQAGFEVERLLQNTQQHSNSKIHFQNQNKSRRERAILICAALNKTTNDNKYLELAFEIAEAGKAAVLLESVRENMARQQMGDSQPLVIELKETEKALAAIESELLSSTPEQNSQFDPLNEQKVFLSQKLLSLKQELQKQYPDYANLTLNEKTLTVLAVQGELLENTNEVFIEFYWGNEFLYVFKIDKNSGITFFEIPIDQALNDRIAQFLDLFSAQNRWNISAETFQSKAFALYQKIFAPFGLDAFSKIIIVPDGLLAFIPFEALVTEEKEAAFFKNLSYLIKHQNIQYAYSGSVLTQQQKAVPSGTGFLFVAPGFANKEHGLPALDASDLNIGKPSGLNQLLNDEATRLHFEKAAPLSRTIHLFTHAEANQNGQQPKVYFYDQALTLPEIYALDLSAELVVLSACETNLGKLEKGEGVMSLARGFAYAGASSLVASLWKVKTKQTAQIFTSFYKNVEAGQTKSSALREAKLAFLEQADDIQASPAYWTGFVFIGSDIEEKKSGINIWTLLGLALLVAGLVFFFRTVKK
jgi:CHAT domain-containing protein